MAPITSVCKVYLNSDHTQRGSRQFVHVHYPRIGFNHSGLQATAIAIGRISCR